MRQFLMMLVVLLVAAGAKADPVSREAAMRSAKSFMTQRSVRKADGLKLAFQGVRAHSAKGRGAAAKDAYYYIFNNDEQGGFVIVSGDDATEEILGYSDTGTVDAENIPVNMQELLDGYQKEIEYARENGLNRAPAADNTAGTVRAKQVVEPLIQTIWGQDEPYNLQCFTTNNQQAVSGCVATAFAQIMYYHKWPQTATKQIPAYSTYEALPATTFDWDHMLPAYSQQSLESEEQKNAVAELMLYCGHAVKMSYGVGASSAVTSYIMGALKSYFGYQNDAIMINRNIYTLNEWDDIIYNELRHGRPIIISASAYKGSGHAFICDGYAGNNLYHINWGWGGMSDGYFRLTALNPNDQGTGGSGVYNGYSIQQSVIYGISPTVIDKEKESEEALPTYGLETKQLSLRNSNNNEITSNITTFDYSPTQGLNNFYFSYMYHRIATEGAYDVGMGIFQGDQLIEAKAISKNVITDTNTYMTLYNDLSGAGKNLSDGSYVIKGVDCPTGTNNWVASKGSDIYYFTLEISNGQATAKKVVVTTSSQLEVTNVEQDLSSVFPKKLNFYLKNSGNGDYKGQLYLLCDGQVVASEGAYVAPGAEEKVTFVFTCSAAEHQFVISNSPYGSNPIYSGSITLKGELAAYSLTKVSEHVKNVVNGTLYGTLFEAFLTIQNDAAEDYNGQFKIRLLKSMTGDAWGNFGVYDELVDVSIPAGGIVTIPVKCQAAIGDVIIVRVYESTVDDYDYQNFFMSKGTYTVAPGVVKWTADGERTAAAPTSTIKVNDNVVAVEFEGMDLSGYTITPNSNPNTIYIIGPDETVPASLNGKNVVKGYKANGNLTLQEGYDFFIPKNITVDGTVSYSRTPEQSSNGNGGWSTIVLPFSVQKVMNATDNEQVEWRTLADNADKDFWLKCFKSVTDDEVNFDYVNGWVANEPYIIAVPEALKGKEMVFSATATTVFPTISCKKITDSYSFVGTTADVTLETAYVMNETGDAFIPMENADVMAGNAYFTTTASPEKIPISLGGLLGDVNGDGTVDISDITMLVNYLLGKPAPGIILTNANVNGDDTVDISDVTGISSIILGN